MPRDSQRVSIKHRDQNLLTDYLHFLQMKLCISELVVPWSLSWLCSLQLGADKQVSQAENMEQENSKSKKEFLLSL